MLSPSQKHQKSMGFLCFLQSKKIWARCLEGLMGKINDYIELIHTIYIIIYIYVYYKTLRNCLINIELYGLYKPNTSEKHGMLMASFTSQTKPNTWCLMAFSWCFGVFYWMSWWILFFPTSSYWISMELTKGRLGCFRMVPFLSLENWVLSNMWSSSAQSEF